MTTLKQFLFSYWMYNPTTEKFQTSESLKRRVTDIVDGDTFGVSTAVVQIISRPPRIIVRVRPTGYNTPEKGEPGFEEATKKLKDLLLGKEVTLQNPVKLDRDRVVCDVIYEGKELRKYFPEY